jgi:importin-5
MIMISSCHYPWQAHAASAILNFSENCTPEILTPYLDGIVGKLLVLLQVC